MERYAAAGVQMTPAAQIDDLRERAEEIADFAVGERHNDGMYQRVADMALKELRAAVEAEREACCTLDVKPLPDSPPETGDDQYWQGFWDGRDALRQAIRRRT